MKYILEIVLYLFVLKAFLKPKTCIYMHNIFC